MSRGSLLRMGRNALSPLILAMVGLGMTATVASARVVRVEVRNQEVVSDFPELGRFGPYEVIKGLIYLEVDPEGPDAATAAETVKYL